MQFKDAYASLEKSKEFSAWKKKNKNCFAAHALVMREGTKDSEWQIGFYNPKIDKEVVFSLLNPVKVSEEMDIFKKPGTKVEQLDIKKINIEFDKAVEIAEKVLADDYAPEKQNRTIIILQNLEKKQLWNITFITNSFNMINIRIDADKGIVLKKNISSLYSLGKRVD